VNEFNHSEDGGALSWTDPKFLSQSIRVKAHQHHFGSSYRKIINILKSRMLKAN
jgi:hypothetical protein